MFAWLHAAAQRPAFDDQGQGKRAPSEYPIATRLQPYVHVGNLVFQGGEARLRTGSLTGGGQVYAHEFQGYFQPLVYPNAPGVASFVGGGQIVAYPPSLAALYGGQAGNGN